MDVNSSPTSRSGIGRLPRYLACSSTFLPLTSRRHSLLRDGGGRRRMINIMKAERRLRDTLTERGFRKEETHTEIHSQREALERRKHTLRYTHRERL